LRRLGRRNRIFI